MSFRVEFPAAYLDNLQLEEGVDRPVLINRNPEPGEAAVLIGANIQIEIADVGVDGIDESATQVYVDGNLAFDGGVFQTGYTGAASASTAPQANVRRIVIDPTSDFVSEAIVLVRVVSEVVGGAETIDESYVFTVEDITPPIFILAEAKDLRRVRVTFDDFMKRDTASDADDALNPSNYTIIALSSPAVNVVPVEVREVSPRVFDVVVNIDFTPGAMYRVIVQGAANDSGIAIVTANVADFTAFSPLAPQGRRFELIKFLPAINRRGDITGDLAKFVAVMQETTDVLLASVDKFPDSWNIDEADEAFLDAILCDQGNPWKFDLTLVNKRRLAGILVPLYQQKGTEVGIVNAVRFFTGVEVTVTPYDSTGIFLGSSLLGFDFILDASAAYELRAFNLDSAVTLTDQQRKDIATIGYYMKPVGTHMVAVTDPVILAGTDHIVLGESELGDVGIDGTWILH